MNKLLSILLIFSFVFTQEPCEGQCLPDEVVKELRVSILTLENDKESNEKIIENLNSQIYMYIQSDSLYKSQIIDYKKQLEFKDDMIKLVKPKWYDNKYLWYTLGVASMIVPIWGIGQIK